jgi:hypothetical protein
MRARALLRGAALAVPAAAAAQCSGSGSGRSAADVKQWAAEAFGDRIEFLLTLRCGGRLHGLGADPELAALGDSVFAWLRSVGGECHASIAVALFGSNPASRGGLRGYAATADISAGELIVAVPLDGGAITVEAALRDAEIGPQLRAMAAAALADDAPLTGAALGDALPLACLAVFLCHHARRGDASPWAPVIASLPLGHDALFAWSDAERAELAGTDLEGAGERDRSFVDALWANVVAPTVHNRSLSRDEFTAMYGVLLGRYFGAPAEAEPSEPTLARASGGLDDAVAANDGALLAKMRRSATVWPLVAPVADLLNHGVGAGSWAVRTTTSTGAKDLCFFSDVDVAAGEQVLIDYSSYATLAVGLVEEASANGAGAAGGDALAMFAAQGSNAHHVSTAGWAVALNCQETVVVPLRIGGGAGAPRPSRRDEATKRALFDALTGAASGAASTDAADAAAASELSFTIAVGPIAQVSCLLFTVTFSANRAHNLTRSP